MLWVPTVLGVADNTTPTLLNAMVAIGIVIGAAAAGRLVTLSTAQRCMPAGILIGLLVLLFSLQYSLALSYPLLLLVGVCGGFLWFRSTRYCSSAGAKVSAPATLSRCRIWGERGHAADAGVLFRRDSLRGSGGGDRRGLWPSVCSGYRGGLALGAALRRRLSFSVHGIVTEPTLSLLILCSNLFIS